MDPFEQNMNMLEELKKQLVELDAHLKRRVRDITGHCVPDEEFEGIFKGQGECRVFPNHVKHFYFGGRLLAVVFPPYFKPDDGFPQDQNQNTND